jgi:hypothetical protein
MESITTAMLKKEQIILFSGFLNALKKSGE